MTVATIKRILKSDESSSSSSSLFRDNAISLHVSVPCPLKVRLKMTLEQFIDEYNQTHYTPVHCPTIMENGPHSIEDIMATAQHEDDLPDVWVANSYHTSFSQPFRSRFIDSGIYQGITKEEWLPLLQDGFRDLAEHHNIGFLAFGSWSAVADLSVAGEEAVYPKTWTDMTEDAFKGKIGIHGCQGHATGSALLMVLRERMGVEGISKFSSNLGQIGHFSKIIKAMDSSDASRPMINIMPSAAIQQIPSKKRVAELALQDGPILTPVMLFVKRSKLDQVKDILSFIWSDTFRNVLALGGILMPDQLNWSNPYTLPDLKQITIRDFNDLSEELDVEFMKGLSPELKA